MLARGPVAQPLRGARRMGHGRVTLPRQPEPSPACLRGYLYGRDPPLRLHLTSCQTAHAHLCASTSLICLCRLLPRPLSTNPLAPTFPPLPPPFLIPTPPTSSPGSPLQPASSPPDFCLHAASHFDAQCRFLTACFFPAELRPSSRPRLHPKDRPPDAVKQACPTLRRTVTAPSTSTSSFRVSMQRLPPLALPDPPPARSLRGRLWANSASRRRRQPLVAAPARWATALRVSTMAWPHRAWAPLVAFGCTAAAGVPQTQPLSQLPRARGAARCDAPRG